MKTMGYAALNATTPLVPFSFERRALRRNDVAIEILWSGCATAICIKPGMTGKSGGRPFTPAFPGTKLLAG